MFSALGMMSLIKKTRLAAANTSVEVRRRAHAKAGSTRKRKQGLLSNMPTNCISIYRAAEAMSPKAVNEALLIQQKLPESECCLKYLTGVAPDIQLKAAGLCLESLSAPVIGQVFF